MGVVTLSMPNMICGCVGIISGVHGTYIVPQGIFDEQLFDNSQFMCTNVFSKVNILVRKYMHVRLINYVNLSLFKS